MVVLNVLSRSCCLLEPKARRPKQATKSSFILARNVFSNITDTASLLITDGGLTSAYA